MKQPVEIVKYIAYFIMILIILNIILLLLDDFGLAMVYLPNLFAGISLSLIIFIFVKSKKNASVYPEIGLGAFAGLIAGILITLGNDGLAITVDKSYLFVNLTDVILLAVIIIFFKWIVTNLKIKMPQHVKYFVYFATTLLTLWTIIAFYIIYIYL